MISDAAQEMYDYHLTGIERLTATNGYWDSMEINMLKAVASLSGNYGSVSEHRKNFDKDVEAMEICLKEAEVTILSAEDKKILKDFETQVQNFKIAANRVFELCLASPPNIAQIYSTLNDVTKMTLDLDGVLDEIIVHKTRISEDLNTQTDNLSLMASIIEIALLVLVIGFSIFIAIFIATGIEKSLREIIAKLSQSTGNISTSATELNDASESLATGSSRQAAAIEETSATMNETSSMVQQNAENTRVAAQIADNALSEVNEAGRVMSELMATMAELKESSDKVSKIVKTIDNIAFQTNLLAINATVEAARAGGDAGRSFAVVAQEVRSLAQKSADASKETADIIEKNIALTDTSRSGAEQVGVIAGSNAKNIADLSKLISEISAASEEQSSGIKQINIAVSQMEKVTQENAAVAEENAASSNSMKGEIANLEDAVDIAKSLIRGT